MDFKKNKTFGRLCGKLWDGAGSSSCGFLGAIARLCEFWFSHCLRCAHGSGGGFFWSVCVDLLCFRCLWIGCVLTAMALFIYQVADRTFAYFDYNTTVSVNVLYTESVPFPAVTLCNINTFRSDRMFAIIAFVFSVDAPSNFAQNSRLSSGKTFV